MDGPLPVEGGNAIERIIQVVVPGFKARPHWVDTGELPEEVYTLIERKFSELEANCQRAGLPELICCPLDEVSAGSQDFGVKILRSIEAGRFTNLCHQESAGTRCKSLRSVR
jgi:hypothetical protein